MPVPARPIAVHVLTRLHVGGLSRPVLASLERMSRLGVRTVLITGVPEREETEVREMLAGYPDLPVLRLKRFVIDPAPWKDIRTLAAVTTAVKRLRPTVVHTHTPKAGGLGRLATCIAGGCGLGRRGKPPLRVHTFHGYAVDPTISGSMAPLWRGFERQLARHASDRVVALSPSQREEMIARLGEQIRPKTAVVPLAYDATRVNSRTSSNSVEIRPRESAHERIVTYLGDGLTTESYVILAHAHARLLSSSPKLAERLRVVIPGAVDPRVRRQIERVLLDAGLAERWEFVGGYSDPGPLLAKVDAVVFPSRSDGTPVCIIDALAAGLPVVAASAGGVVELLENRWEQLRPGSWITRPSEARGLLVPQDDLEAWAAALGRLVEDLASVPGSAPERRRFVEEVFDAHTRTRELVDLYELRPSAGRRTRIRSLPREPEEPSVRNTRRTEDLHTDAGYRDSGVNRPSV